MSDLEARAVTVTMRGLRVLDQVGLMLAPGELVGLIGPNAAGKTTLVRTLAGLRQPDDGIVLFDGKPIADLPRQILARRLAYLPQAAVCHWPLTVERLVGLGRLPHTNPWQRSGPGDQCAIDAAMDEADVRHLANRPVTTLSGGEAARAMLARALAGNPAVLLADEPVAQLDPAHQIRVMRLLRAMAARGCSVLVVLHDLTLAARFCARLVLLHAGRVEAEGSPPEVLTPDLLRRVYGISAEYGRHGGSFYVVPWAPTGEDEGDDADANGPAAPSRP